MTSRAALATIVAVVVTLPACGSDAPAGPATRSRASEVAAPTLTPVPVQDWGGNVVDLMVADAWASCSFLSDDTAAEWGYSDDYINHVRQLAKNTSCAGFDDSAYGPYDLAKRWYTLRNDPNCNVDPSTGLAASAGLKKVVLKQGIPGPYDGGWETVRPMAERALRAAPTNLCVAQKLRAVAPGASGGEALLMSGPQQLFLLETIRERAQVAMLQYAALGIAFGSELVIPDSPHPNPTTGVLLALPVLMNWSHGTPGASEDDLGAMGDDFATAVQLHVTVSTELADLLGRSSSARSVRGGTSSSTAQDTWGPGSWRQRLLAATYGGAPLAQVSEGAPVPWAGMGVENYPGMGNVTWPEKGRLPFVDVDVQDPRVGTLWGLARACNVMDVEQTVDDASGCSVISQPSSASRLMAAVEACVRNQYCYTSGLVILCGDQPGPCVNQTPSCPTWTPADVANVNYEDTELWKRHRVHPDHGRELVSLWSEMLRPSCSENLPDGPFDLDGKVTLQDLAPGSTLVHMDPKARFVARSLAEIAPTFHDMAPIVMPRRMDPLGPAHEQGLAGASNPGQNDRMGDRMRRAGAASALAAARYGILVGMGGASSFNPHALKFYQRALTAKPVIDAAVGEDWTHAEPVWQVKSDWGVGPYMAPVTDADGRVLWRVNVAPAAGDPFWTAAATYELVVAQGNKWASNLASFPDSQPYDASLSGIIADAAIHERTASLDLGTGATFDSLLWLSDLPTQGDTRTLLVRRSLPSNPDTYQLLAGRARMTVDGSELAGLHYSFGGSLGIHAQRMLEVSSKNPSRPRYDGFGYPIDWVPPADPAILGSSGGTATEHYLGRAQENAELATAAVKDAVESLLREQSDEAQVAASVTKSQAVAKLAKEGLCGDGNANCDTTTQGVVLNFNGYSGFGWDPPTTCPAAAGDRQGQIDCIILDTLNETNVVVDIGSPVVARLGDGSVPSFSSYKGGELQTHFIEEWASLQALKLSVKDYVVAGVAAKQRVTEAAAQLAAFEANQNYNCSNEAYENAKRAGTSTSVSIGVSNGRSNGISAGFPGGIGGSVSSSQTFSKSTSTTTNEGPLIAQQQKCRELTNTLSAEQQKPISALWDAFTVLSGKHILIADAMARVQKASAAGSGALQQAELAKKREELETAQLASSQQTSFGLYRRYHSYDLWRAKALLEAARRSAVAARRSAEARFAADLTTMKAPEAFVAGPSTWADSVYDYDLDVPSAVGLAIAKPESGGIYANKLTDYVGNLSRFVDGFAVNRPSAAAHDDTEVLSLPPPTGASSLGPELGSTAEGTPYGWSFACNGAVPEFVALPIGADPTSLCGGKNPQRARLVFSLDPWGRVGLDIAHEPFKNRYNARWTQLAVNLVGTGIRDCGLSADPQACYGNPIIPFDLTHVGPAWVTNYEQEWRSLAIPKGRIEGGKALAAELWLDSVATSWAKPYVAAVQRTEYRERPFGGAYQLDLVIGPEVRLDHIERVQVLVGTSYWVKQDLGGHRDTRDANGLHASTCCGARGGLCDEPGVRGAAVGGSWRRSGGGVSGGAGWQGSACAAVRQWRCWALHRGRRNQRRDRGIRRWCSDRWSRWRVRGRQRGGRKRGGWRDGRSAGSASSGRLRRWLPRPSPRGVRRWRVFCLRGRVH